MGTTAHVLVTGGDRRSLLRQAHARIDQLEACWTRFRPTSELSRLNARAGRTIRVSSDLWLLVERSVAAWQLTGGAFDPTVLAAVVAAGYDRDFRVVPSERASAAPTPEPPPGCDGIRLDPRRQRVTLPAGVALDPGGIGKGLAADVVTAELLRAGAGGALVSLGGDVRVRGAAPDGDPWTVAVEHPAGRGDLLRVGLDDGAVATSSTIKRRWKVGGVDRHHVIDPRSGACAAGLAVAATAVAGEGWWAEALATAALLGRAPGGSGYLLTVGSDGRMAADPALLELTA